MTFHKEGIFLRQGRSVNLEHSIFARLESKPQDLLFFAQPEPQCYGCPVLMLSFHRNARDPASGPPVCAVRVLPTEASS